MERFVRYHPVTVTSNLYLLEKQTNEKCLQNFSSKIYNENIT
jgi:hypothetical protein